MKRAKKIPVPLEKKDADYYINRAKNNLSAMINRRKKARERHEKKQRYLLALQKNKILREKIKYLEMEYYYLLSEDFLL